MAHPSRTRVEETPLDSARVSDIGDTSNEPAEATHVPEPDWRVEELAARAGLSVDTIRFYQKRRLLSPPRREGRVGWYSAAHLERLNRIRELQRDGLSLAVIGRVVRGELSDSDAPLAAAVAAATRHDDREEVVDFPDLARQAGVPEALLVEVAEHGLLVPRSGDERAGYTTADVHAVRAGAELIRQGVPLEELLDLAQAHHEATETIAERAVEMFDTYVRDPLKKADLPAAQRAERLVASFDAMLQAVTALVDHHFRRVLLQVAQQHLDRGDDRDANGAAARRTQSEPSEREQAP